MHGLLTARDPEGSVLSGLYGSEHTAPQCAYDGFVASRPIPAYKKNTGMMEMMLGCVAAAFLFVAVVWLTIQAFL